MHTGSRSWRVPLARHTGIRNRPATRRCGMIFRSTAWRALRIGASRFRLVAPPASGPVRSPPLRLPQRQGRSPARRPAASQAPCGPLRSTPLFTIPSASRAGGPAGRRAAQHAGLGRRPARRRAAGLARDYTPRPARPPLLAPPTLRAPLPRPHRGEPLRGTLRGVAGVATRRFTRVCYTDPFSFWGPLGEASVAERGSIEAPCESHTPKPRRNRSSVTA